MHPYAPTDIMKHLLSPFAYGRWQSGCFRTNKSISTTHKDTKEAPHAGMLLFLVNSGYSAVRVDFNSPSSVGELILISDLTVGEIKIVCRDSVGFHHLFCKLTI